MSLGTCFINEQCLCYVAKVFSPLTVKPEKSINDFFLSFQWFIPFCFCDKLSENEQAQAVVLGHSLACSKNRGRWF
jgi:hypothetical protein